MVKLARSGSSTFCGLALVGSLSFTGEAFAQADTPAAEALFQRARALFDEGRVGEACPKFEESFALEAATGTLLGLAMCREAEGKLATAWAAYLEVEGRAARDADAKREEFAKQKAAELAPRLSSVTLVVSDTVAEMPGLEIRRNGTNMGRGMWGVPVPVDGGEHRIEVSAPHKRAWHVTVDVEREGATKTIEIPVLEDSLQVAPPPIEPDKPLGSDANPEEPRQHSDMNATKWAGVACAGAGLVSLAVGGYFLGEALDADDTSQSDCLGTTCTAEGARLRRQAVADADTATIFGISGAVLVGAGATLFFVFGDAAPPVASSGPDVTVAAGLDGFVAQLRGRF